MSEESKNITIKSEDLRNKPVSVELKEEESNKLIIKSDENLTESNKVAIDSLGELSNYQDMLEFSKVLVASNMVPFDKPEQVVTVILKGRELGFSPILSLYNIYYISGKPSISIHAIGALIRKNGISYKIIEDAQYLDGNGEPCGRDEHEDVRTTIKFYYLSKIGTGNNAKYIPMEESISYTWSDAKRAGLAEKDNWKKMPKIMLYTRAFTLGARRVAPEILLGMMEITEMADVEGLNYEIDEEGNLKKI